MEFICSESLFLFSFPFSLSFPFLPFSTFFLFFWLCFSYDFWSASSTMTCQTHGFSHFCSMPGCRSLCLLPDHWPSPLPGLESSVCLWSPGLGHNQVYRLVGIWMLGQSQEHGPKAPLYESLACTRLISLFPLGAVMMGWGWRTKLQYSVTLPHLEMENSLFTPLCEHAIYSYLRSY